MSSAIAAVKALRERCWGNGWRVVPVQNRSKAPIGSKWPVTAMQDPPECLRWDPVPHALNTGIACAGLRPLDLDIDTPEIVRSVIDLAFNRLGVTIVRSRPDSCRVLLLYRAAEGAPRKRSLVGASHSDACGCKIECLGAGLQFLAFGTHPDGEDLQWRDGGPDTIGVSMVPAITEDALTAFLEAAAPLIGADPPSKPDGGAQRRPRDGNGNVVPFERQTRADGADTGATPTPVGLVRLIDELADYSTNSYDDWIRVGMAFYHESDGSDAGLAAWDDWSAKSDHYNAAGLAKKWPTFGRGRTGAAVTGATIIYLARQARMARAGPAASPPVGGKPAATNGAAAAPAPPSATTGHGCSTPGQAPSPRPPPPPEPPSGGGEGGSGGPPPPPPPEPEPPEPEPPEEEEPEEAEPTEPAGPEEPKPGGRGEGEEGSEGDDEGEAGPGPEWLPGPDEIADEDRPPITVVKGLLHRLADEAEAAIIASRVPVYHRGVLVRPAVTEFDAADGGKTHIAILHPLSVPNMMDLFCRTAAWRKWGGERKGYVPDDPPPMVARILLGRVGQWRVPQVRGILSTPTIRRDGTLLRTPGYDKASRYFLALPPDLHVPAISAAPSKSEALAAIRLLEALLIDFPWIDDGGASKAVGLSLLICAVIRPAMIVCPIHAATAPAAGTGKSYLYDIAGALAYGDRCPVVFAGKGPEELEKKLNGILLRGSTLFNIDNLNTPLEGDLICQAAERPLLDLRRLGKSDMFLTPNSALVGATANNMVVHDDLNRRTLMAGMDANMERPELRDFKGANPFQTVLKDRGKYIAAVLTVVLGCLANQPNNVDLSPLASYDAYTRFVREPLWWLGRADPAKTMDALAAADPVRNELLGVITAWEATIGLNAPITVATIMRNIEHPPMPKREDFGGDSAKWTAACNASREAWNDFAATIHAAAAPHGGKATARDIGDWLGRRSKRITADGRRFVSKQGHASTKTWWLATNS